MINLKLVNLFIDWDFLLSERHDAFVDMFGPGLVIHHIVELLPRWTECGIDVYLLMS